MNLTELRVGNFVTQGKKDAYRVVSVNKESVFIDLPKSDKLPFGAKWKNDARNIEPVPITEEWLEKLGFGMQGAGPHYYMISKDVYLLFFPSECRILLVDDHQSVGLPVSVRHVHQLQNLVFALTGEELEVK